jgi:hypothetical protein
MCARAGNSVIPLAPYGRRQADENGASGVRIVESLELGLVRRGVLRHANQRNRDADERGRQGKTERSAAQCDSAWDGNRNTALNGMIPDRPVPLE